MDVEDARVAERLSVFVMARRVTPPEEHCWEQGNRYPVQADQESFVLPRGTRSDLL